MFPFQPQVLQCWSTKPVRSNQKQWMLIECQARGRWHRVLASLLHRREPCWGALPLSCRQRLLQSAAEPRSLISSSVVDPWAYVLREKQEWIVSLPGPVPHNSGHEYCVDPQIKIWCSLCSGWNRDQCFQWGSHREMCNHARGRECLPSGHQAVFTWLMSPTPREGPVPWHVHAWQWSCLVFCLIIFIIFN